MSLCTVRISAEKSGTKAPGATSSALSSPVVNYTIPLPVYLVSRCRVNPHRAFRLFPPQPHPYLSHEGSALLQACRSGNASECLHCIPSSERYGFDPAVSTATISACSRMGGEVMSIRSSMIPQKVQGLAILGLVNMLRSSGLGVYKSVQSGGTQGTPPTRNHILLWSDNITHQTLTGAIDCPQHVTELSSVACKADVLRPKIVGNGCSCFFGQVQTGSC